MPQAATVAAGRVRRWPLALLLLTSLTAHGAELREVLDSLSRQHGFVLQGLDNVDAGNVSDELPHGDPEAQIRQLLQRYNYLVVSRDAHRIEKVVIIGAKRDAPGIEPDHSVPIQRDGLHHRVDALLTGANGQVVATTLIIDTGASSVVLPTSMIERLGFQERDLAQTTSRTASGTVPVKLATLTAVAVGESQVRDVAVSFVDDSRLGELRLLGMSFLRRFRVTIDDQNQRLILVDR